MNDDNKKYYFQEASAEEFKDALDFITSQTDDLVTLWEEGKDSEAEFFEAESYIEEEKKLTLKSAAGILAKLTGPKLTNKEVYLKIPHPRFVFFSTSRLKYDKDNSQYYIVLNQKVFKGQRRTNFRLAASRLSVIQFKMDNQVFDGLDISAGGTSVLIEPHDKERFAKGKEFEKCTIRLNRRQFEIPMASIVGMWDWVDELGNKTEKIKLGISFSGLSDALEEDLFKHINIEARAVEMHKKFKK